MDSRSCRSGFEPMYKKSQKEKTRIKVWVVTKQGVGHGLSYGLPVVNFIKRFTLESLKFVINHKCKGIAPIKAKIQIRYILALKHKSEPCI